MAKKNLILARAEAYANEEMKILEKANNILLSFFKPEIYDTSQKESVLIKNHNEFEQTCFALSEHTNKEVKELTVSEFFNLLEMLEKRAKSLKERKK